MDLDKFSFEGLSDVQIERLITMSNDELRNRKVGRRKTVADQILKLAKENGFELNELFGGTVNAQPMVMSKSKKPTRSVRVKYRSPHNSENTWSGRGKQPLWVGEWLAQGGKLEELLVPKD